MTVCVTVAGDDTLHHMTTQDVALALDTPRGKDEMHAIRRANEVRLARAELKRKIGDGTVPISDVILTCPWEAASMTITELLTSQRRWETTRSNKFLADIGFSETKTIGSLTEIQRSALSSMLL